MRRNSSRIVVKSLKLFRYVAFTCNQRSADGTFPFRSGGGSPKLKMWSPSRLAPFNRYETLDVVRAVAESGRDDIALYTGNDDNIVLDLLTPYRFSLNGQVVERRMVGGLLGHWAVWHAPGG